MAKTYQLTPMTRLVNSFIKGVLRLGLGLPNTYLLTTRGRKSGKLYTTPVALVEQNGERWLVAPYGEVNWVKNARAAGEVTLTRKGKNEVLHVQPINVNESGWILKAYVRQQPITQPYFDARPESPDAAFTAEAARHPVFKLIPK